MRARLGEGEAVLPFEGVEAGAFAAAALELGIELGEPALGDTEAEPERGRAEARFVRRFRGADLEIELALAVLDSRRVDVLGGSRERERGHRRHAREEDRSEAAHQVAPAGIAKWHE